MAEQTEQEWKQAVERGEFPRASVLYGAETFLLHKAAKKLMHTVAGNVFPDFNLQKLDGTTASLEQIADAVQALPFLAPKKCVALNDFNVESRSAQEVRQLVELMGQVPDTTVFLLYYPSAYLDYKKSAKWKSFFSAAKRVATTVEFALRTKPELEKLLCAAAAKRDCQLSRAHAGTLIDQCGSDLQTLYQELEKLCAFVQSGTITRADVQQVVTKNLETTVFLLAKALLSGKYDRAYEILNELFEQNEEPVGVLAVLASSYVDLYRVRAMLQSGKPVSELTRWFEDYKGREFRLRYAERDVAGMSLELLRDSLEVLLQTDVALKSSRADSRLWMEELIARLLCLSQKERSH